MGNEPMSASEAGKTEKRKMTVKEQKLYDAAVLSVAKAYNLLKTSTETLEAAQHPDCVKLQAQLTRRQNGLHKFWYKRSPDVREERARKSKENKIERLKKKMAELEAELEDE